MKPGTGGRLVNCDDEARRQAERLHLRREYVRCRDAGRDKLLTGPHGDLTRKLLAVVRGAVMLQPDNVVRFLLDNSGRLRAMDEDVQFEMLHLAAEIVADLRMAERIDGLSSPLPDQHDDIFLILRTFIRG